MSKFKNLASALKKQFSSQYDALRTAHDEITMELPKQQLLAVCQGLRDGGLFQFDMLVDVCGVDYLTYGQDEWETTKATDTGFERGVEQAGEREQINPWKKPRFAVVYHLLSLVHNHRLRLKVYLNEDDLLVESVIKIWPSADWFEREAFDLYGILFANHPDLRRILTDYGFIGHPFRKDFPLSGHVEVRYDAAEERVIYIPVDIEPRVLVPKVIRKDSRYDIDPTQVPDKKFEVQNNG